MRAPAWAFALLFAASAAAEEPTVSALPGGRLVTAVLPGRAVDLAVVPVGDGRKLVAALLAPAEDADGPRSVVVLDTAAASLVEIAGGLSPETDALAHLDLGGDGRHELLIGEPGKIASLGPPGGGPRAPRPLLETPSLDLRRLDRRGAIVPELGLLPQPSVGLLELYRQDADGAMSLAAEVELPIRARREHRALVLSTPPMSALPRDGASPLLVFGPETHGAQRLLTTLVDPDAPADPDGDSDESEPLEAWARLPAPEEVEQSWFVLVDGRPTLVVTTTSSEKIGIFEKLKVRVFPLRTGRTRAGTPSVLSTLTVTRHWYSAGVEIVDLDGDGRDDLAVLQPDGLGAKKLAVEVFRGKGTGGFFSSGRKSVIEAPGADWHYGGDVDGDGAPDLVVAGDEQLRIFPGLAGHKKLVFAKKPRWSVDMARLGSGGEDDEEEVYVVVEIDDEDSDDFHVEVRSFGWLTVEDFDGDGRGEILLRAGGKRTVLKVVTPE